MKIGIIGAGFTGLAAGLKLQEQGHEVTIFEKEEKPGGLAIGFEVPDWQWSLENHYHHFFVNDQYGLNLAKKINHQIIQKRPKTSVYIDGQIYQLDSPLKALTFPKLSLFERLRMGATLGLLRYNPFWQPLEKIKAVPFLEKAMGKKAYQMIWKPQLIGKFGDLAKEISLAWFWARVYKRTTNLAYPEKGYLSLANQIVKVIKQKGGTFYFNTEVIKLSAKEKPQIHFKKNGKCPDEFHSCGIPYENPDGRKPSRIPYGNYHRDYHREKMENGKYDAVIVTLPSYQFLNITENLPLDYKNNLKKLQGLGVINLVLRLKQPFLSDGTYWLSVCEKNSPIMAIVEHTNFMDKSNYNNEHLVYLGKYLPKSHPYFLKSAQELLEIYDPFLKKINKDYKKTIIDIYVSKDPYAQPIIPINYSKIKPLHQTPLPNVYLANMEQVYPWDRGVNYAIELGERVAELI